MEEKFKGLFIGEGSSDSPLARVVSDAFAVRGYDVDMRVLPSAELRQTGSTIAVKLRAAIQLFSEFEFIVVHRDCDNETPEVRVGEIKDAVTEVFGSELAVIFVVPRTMTEAWCLLDESAIRRVAGKPSGRTRLDLPKKRNLEGIRDPKAFLQQAILAASEESGRRRLRRSSRFDADRINLLESLSMEHLAGVPSWEYTVDSIDVFLRAHQTSS